MIPQSSNSHWMGFLQILKTSDAESIKSIRKKRQSRALQKATTHKKGKFGINSNPEVVLSDRRISALTTLRQVIRIKVPKQRKFAALLITVCAFLKFGL